MPAAFNGVYGFKPTTGRNSIVGVKYDCPTPFNLIKAATGPQARSVEDLKLFVKA